MSKYSELVYMVNDLLKLISDDSVFTEDHIIYLLDTTRSFLLKQKYNWQHVNLSTYKQKTLK